MSLTTLEVALARYPSTAEAMLVWGRIRLQDELEHLALDDRLTGLANRRLLQEYLTPTLSAAHRHGTPLAAAFLDLDGSTAINGTLGHGVGDLMLRAVSGCLLDVVRQDDIVGRMAGDEFLIICANTEDATAETIAERLRVAVRTTADRIKEDRQRPGYSRAGLTALRTERVAKRYVGCEASRPNGLLVRWTGYENKHPVNPRGDTSDPP